MFEYTPRTVPTSYVCIYFQEIVQLLTPGMKMKLFYLFLYSIALKIPLVPQILSPLSTALPNVHICQLFRSIIVISNLNGKLKDKTIIIPPYNKVLLMKLTAHLMITTTTQLVLNDVT